MEINAMDTAEKSYGKNRKSYIVRVSAAIGMLVILLAVFWATNRFIIGARKAEEKVNAYEAAQYMHPEMVDMSYDWYLGGGYIGKDYRYNPKWDLIVDEERNELWYKYFERKMETVNEKFASNVLLTDYSLMTYYDGSNAEIRYDDFFLYGVYNTQPVEEGQRVETATEIIWKIIESLHLDYNVCGVHIDYYDLNGVYRFAINMEKETITKEMLAAAVKEISFTDNLLIEEKWKDFTALRKTFWAFPVEDYEIAMMGMEENGDYQLVMRTGEKETVLKTYRRMGANPAEYSHGTFSDILGYDGFYVYEGDFFIYGDYYSIEEEALQKIAQAFGFLIRPEDSYGKDINGDGVSELICNCCYGSGGPETVIIYYNDGTQIQCGSGEDLAEIDTEKVVSKSISSYYIPEENAVFVSYMYMDSEELIEGLYPIELEKIDFYPFEPTEW